jgi:hypothetical protein
MGMFKKEYLPTSRGFNYSSGMLSGASDHYTHMVDGAYDWHRMEQPNFEADGRYAGNLVRDDALSFLAQVSGGVEPQPFFLYLPFQVRTRAPTWPSQQQPPRALPMRSGRCAHDVRACAATPTELSGLRLRCASAVPPLARPPPLPRGSSGRRSVTRHFRWARTTARCTRTCRRGHAARCPAW